MIDRQQQQAGQHDKDAQGTARQLCRTSMRRLDGRAGRSTQERRGLGVTSKATIPAVKALL